MKFSKRVQRFTTTNATLKLLAFLIAVLFWMVEMNRQVNDRVIRIPMYIHVPDHLVVTNKFNRYIEVTIRGQKRKIESVQPSAYSVTLNLRNEAPGLITYTITPKDINITGFKIISILPRNVLIRIDTVKK